MYSFPPNAPLAQVGLSACLWPIRARRLKMAAVSESSVDSVLPHYTPPPARLEQNSNKNEPNTDFSDTCIERGWLPRAVHCRTTDAARAAGRQAAGAVFRPDRGHLGGRNPRDRIGAGSAGRQDARRIQGEWRADLFLQAPAAVGMAGCSTFASVAEVRRHRIAARDHG